MDEHARKIMFSSKSDEWETPQWIFKHFNSIFNFDTDIAASDENHLCPEYFTIKHSALENDWGKRNWLNPPYSRGLLKQFVQKAYEQSLGGKLTVALIAARTDTKCWHDYVMKADVIHFIKGRLKFTINGVAQNSAPFASVIVIWGLFNYDRTK